jgi:hypothetical protein
MLNGSSWIWSFGLQSFEAWQIAAIMKLFQWFVRYGLFGYVYLGENIFQWFVRYGLFGYVYLGENRGRSK